MRNNGKYSSEELDTAKHRPKEERERKSRRPRPERRIPKWVYRTILILIVSAVGVIIWFNRDNLSPQNVMEWAKDRVVGMGTGDGFPQNIPGSTVLKGNFFVSGGNIVIVSDTTFAEYNSTAKQLVSRQHSFSTPELKVCGSRALLFGIGSTTCRLETVSATAASVTSDGSILAGAVAANGVFALVTQADGYLGELTAYTAAGGVQSHYWFSDYYPSAVALNADGTKAVVVGYSAQDGGLVSAVYLIDLNSGETAQPADVYPGNLLIDVYWGDSNTAVAVGDQAAECIDTSSGQSKEYSYGGSTLQAYCSVGGNTALGLSAYQSASSSDFVVLDSSAKETFKQSLNSEIRSVSLLGGTAAVLGDRQVTFYALKSASAQAVQRDAGTDACAVALSSEKSAYILGVSEIRVVARS